MMNNNILNGSKMDVAFSRKGAELSLISDFKLSELGVLSFLAVADTDLLTMQPVTTKVGELVIICKLGSFTKSIDEHGVLTGYNISGDFLLLRSTQDGVSGVTTEDVSELKGVLNRSNTGFYLLASN